MRFPLAVSAAAVVAIAIAACSGGQQPVYTPPPSGSGVASPGALALTGAGQSQSIGTASGITGTLTYVGGTGTVTATSSATAPAGTTTVTPNDRVRVEASSSPTSPNVYYVTITSAAGATLVGLPQVTLTLTTAAVGTFQEAQFTSGAWANVSGATGVPNSTNTAWQFPGGKTPITIPAGGSIFLAFYQGNFPNATPTPVGTPTDVVAESNFTLNGAPAPYATYPGVPTTGSWTQCSINGNAPGATKSPAFSSFTPSPSETAAAAIEAVGVSAPGVGTPAPNQTTVPGPGVAAAVLGGSFAGFGIEDFRYTGFCQVVTVPHNPQLNLSVFAAGNQKQSFFDLEVDQLNSSGQYVSQLYLDPNPIAVPTASAANVGDTMYRSVSAPTSALTPLVGQTVTLFVGIYGDGHGTFGAYYFVNNISLLGNP
jgi:hypothetical protein